MTEFAHSSGELLTNSAAYTGPCYITAAHIMTDGTNAAKLMVYDNTSAAGKVILERTIVGNTHGGSIIWTFPVKCTNGIYVTVTGTGGSCIIEYIRAG